MYINDKINILILLGPLSSTMILGRGFEIYWIAQYSFYTCNIFYICNMNWSWKNEKIEVYKTFEQSIFIFHLKRKNQHPIEKVNEFFIIDWVQ